MNSFKKCSIEHYAVVMHGGKVISNAFNTPNSFVDNKETFLSHAECNALRKIPAKYQIKGTAIDRRCRKN